MIHHTLGWIYAWVYKIDIVWGGLELEKMCKIVNKTSPNNIDAKVGA